MNAVQLYLESVASTQDSYVFTASTFMDFDDGEHLPFLLLGEHHIFDDPLCKYSAVYGQMDDNHNMDGDVLYRQIVRTAEDNIKIIEHCDGHILVLPLRLLSQSEDNNFLYEVGEQAFLSLFADLSSLQDYFQKCATIEDIVRHARPDIGNLILFSDSDNKSLPLEERFRMALDDNKCLIDQLQSDAYNFYMMVYGPIQQALDVIASYLNYRCIPFVRYSVALHYILLLSENVMDIEHMPTMLYKMGTAYRLYNLCDKDAFQEADIQNFILRRDAFQFNKQIFDLLATKGINEKNWWRHSALTRDLIAKTLSDFYEVFPADPI